MGRQAIGKLSRASSTLYVQVSDSAHLRPQSCVSQLGMLNKPSGYVFPPPTSAASPFDANRNQIGSEIRHENMLRANSQQEDCYARLYETYRFEWQTFSSETRRWRLLKEEGGDADSVREAEALAHAAQDRYRRARNKLSEYMMKRSSQSFTPSKSLVAG
jgi:hypothetical protein